jgi:hypothetical protein
MNQSIIIIDDFYDDPMKVREEALKANYDISGNYPGVRSKPYRYEETLSKLEKAIAHIIDRESWNSGQYNGTFQFVKGAEKTWIHTDPHNDYSCVIFLHPNPEPDTGTSMYEHKETGLRFWPREEQAPFDPDWVNFRRVDKVENVFNRAVVFRGNLFHAADGYFGNDVFDGRLFQTFFFDKTKLELRHLGDSD